MSELETSDAPSPRRIWLMAIPLATFAALAVLFWFGLRSGDPSKIPSALLGRPALFYFGSVGVLTILLLALGVKYARGHGSMPATSEEEFVESATATDIIGQTCRQLALEQTLFVPRPILKPL